MDTTIIDRDDLPYFETLLLPETVRKLRDGAPVLALGAVDDGMACGALSGGPQGSRFYIDSLFVSPSCRGRGPAPRFWTSSSASLRSRHSCASCAARSR